MKVQSTRKEHRATSPDWEDRFEQHFSRRGDVRTQELRNYVKKYFELIPQYPDVYLPEIHVIKNSRSQKIFSSVPWMVGNPTFIPPADYVILVELLEDYLVKILGALDRDVFTKTLSRFLHNPDRSYFSKKLLCQNEDLNEIRDLLEGILAEVIPISDFIGIDLIPSFKEEETYYEESLKEFRVRQ